MPPSLWELELDWRPELRAWDEWTAVDVLLYVDSLFEALRGRASQEAILRLLASETAALLVELQVDVLSFANEDCRHSALGHGVFAPCLFMVTSPRRLPAAGLSASQAVDDGVTVEWLADPASSSEELDGWETWPTFERCRAHLCRELNLWPLDDAAEDEGLSGVDEALGRGAATPPPGRGRFSPRGQRRGSRSRR